MGRVGGDLLYAEPNLNASLTTPTTCAARILPRQNENQTRRFPNLPVSLAWGKPGDKGAERKGGKGGAQRAQRVLPYLDIRPWLSTFRRRAPAQGQPETTSLHPARKERKRRGTKPSTRNVQRCEVRAKP